MDIHVHSQGRIINLKIILRLSILQIHASSHFTSFTLPSMSSRFNDSDDNDYDCDYGYCESEIKFDLRDRDRVHNDLMRMYQEGSFNDVCIKLHDGEIKAVKSILAARCEYFAATFRWKSNNNQDVEEIVINDCSKKIMTRVIEYIFSGVLEAKGLNLLEFLELIVQVRKMFPGDPLEDKVHDFSKWAEYEWTHFRIPTNEEIANALSLVETRNLQPEILVELGRVIVTLIIYEDKQFEMKALALVILLSHGVIESIQAFEVGRTQTLGQR